MTQTIIEMGGYTFPIYSISDVFVVYISGFGKLIARGLED